MARKTKTKLPRNTKPDYELVDPHGKVIAYPKKLTAGEKMRLHLK